MADLINSVSAHWIIITIAGLVILSYFFNQLSRKFNVPSAILLIATGFIMKNLIGFSASGSSWIIPVLEVLGTVGLIMIVLEAALDLKLKKDKAGLIIKSFTVSLIILVVTSFFIAFIIKFFLDLDSLTALVYAVPLSIMSSAIVIPSVSNLIDSKREFLIYECTFSDIQGILLFYFLLDLSGSSSIEGVLIDSTIKILLTIVVSVIVSYIMVVLFQRIRTHVKYLLMLSVLILLYGMGKLLHLSSLLIILFFGLVLNNKEVFFRGFLKRLINVDTFQTILKDFKTIIYETAFVVRTFFFILFGMYVTFDSLANISVLSISFLILGVLYAIRYLNLKIFLRTEVYPELFIAPRGLITILLFFAIPEELVDARFDPAILLITILASSIIMMIALIAKGNAVSDIEDDLSGEQIITGPDTLTDNTEQVATNNE